MSTLPCVGAGYHSPTARYTELHHVFPKYLCALLGLPVIRELAALCGTCHNNVHQALDDLVSNGPRLNRDRLATATWALVQRAYGWWAAQVVV